MMSLYWAGCGIEMPLNAARNHFVHVCGQTELCTGSFIVVIANVNTDISFQFQQFESQFIVQQIYTVSGSDEGESLFFIDSMIGVYNAVNNL